MDPGEVTVTLSKSVLEFLVRVERKEVVPRHSHAWTVHGQELAGTELPRVPGTDSSVHGMRPHTSFFSSLVQLTPEGGAAAGA